MKSYDEYKERKVSEFINERATADGGSTPRYACSECDETFPTRYGRNDHERFEH